MCDVTRPHVDSFNWMLKEGLMKAAAVRQISCVVESFILRFLRRFYLWNSKQIQKHELN